MGIIELLIRRRVLTTVLTLIAVIMGALAYRSLGVRRFPEMEYPVVTVVTVYPGASPTEVETNVTKTIEDAVSTVSGIEQITSTSQQGMSLVFIQFKLEEDVDVKAIDVRNKIDLIRAELPDDAQDPIPQKFEFGSFPILELALYGERDVNELYRAADEDLRPMLTQLPGVADVSITGGREREVQVLLSAAKLRKHGVPIGVVAGALRSANVDVPAGTITQRGREYVVRSLARFRKVEEVAAVRVPTSGGGIVTVGDLGTVVDTYEDKRKESRFDGKEAVIISILARTDANEVEAADAVYALMPRLRQRLPQGSRLDIAGDTSVYIRGALSNVWQNMLIGLALTTVTLYLFLKSIRSTFIAAVAMPASIVVAFLGMQASGCTLNILSLTGLAMTVGVLVNNAILIVEDSTRLVDGGMSPVDAATHGTRDIALAIMGSTATNLVVFIPLAFMGEVIGRLFRELGLTVVYATVVSLLVSYSLTPMMCGAWLRPVRGGQARRSWGDRLEDATIGLLADATRRLTDYTRNAYATVLDWCLRHRSITLALTGIAVVLSLAVFPTLGLEFMPSSDEGRFVVTVEMPLGTPLDATDATVRRIEDVIRQIPHLEHWTTKVGSRSGMGVRSEGVDLAEMTVTVVDRGLRKESLDDIVNQLAPKLAVIPGPKITVGKEEHGPAGAAVSIELTGDDLGNLQAVSERVKSILQATPGTSGVRTSLEAGQPELRILPDQSRTNRYGFTRGGVSQELRSYIEGVTASQFLDRDENYDVVVRLREEDRSQAGDLALMFASGGTGGMMPLAQLGRIVEEPGSTLILRKDRLRLVTVGSNLTGARPLSEVLNDARAEIESGVPIPAGVTLAYGGQAEMMQKNFKELYKALAIGSVLTFLTTAGIIESFGVSVVIILSLPICLIGVAVAMLVYGTTINVFSLMGLIVFVGLAVNNSIIVADYAMRAQQRGLSALEAVREACLVRYRMILLTNLTNIVALIPLSLGLGFAGEIFRPLAVVQMGGNLAAMILTMLVIPPIFVMLRGGKAPAGPTA
jgi:HAE1 family hydrophobic/amphiphilic exporter-1